MLAQSNQASIVSRGAIIGSIMQQFREGSITELTLSGALEASVNRLENSGASAVETGEVEEEPGGGSSSSSSSSSSKKATPDNKKKGGNSKSKKAVGRADDKHFCLADFDIDQSTMALQEFKFKAVTPSFVGTSTAAAAAGAGAGAFLKHASPSANASASANANASANASAMLDITDLSNANASAMLDITDLSADDEALDTAVVKRLKLESDNAYESAPGRWLDICNMDAKIWVDF
jgi:hypothetical protein